MNKYLIKIADEIAKPKPPGPFGTALKQEAVSLPVEAVTTGVGTYLGDKYLGKHLGPKFGERAGAMVGALAGGKVGGLASNYMVLKNQGKIGK